jgi:hypothetical protein
MAAGTGFPQLASMVTSAVDLPLGSPSLEGTFREHFKPTSSSKEIELRGFHTPHEDKKPKCGSHDTLSVEDEFTAF